MGIGGWLLMVALAVALGFVAGRFWPASGARIMELERDRDTAREDLRNYRQDVNVHFARTAELFDKVTADYRGLYEHLALGARQLGSIRSESVAAPLEEPEQRRLTRTETAEAAETAEAEEDSSPPVAAETGSPPTLPLDIGATVEDGSATTASAHPPPANDEEVQPREATTGR